MTKRQKRLQDLIKNNSALTTFFADHPSEMRELASFVEKEGWRARLATSNEMIGRARELENVCGKEPEDCCCFHRLEEFIAIISEHRLEYVKQSNAGEDVFSPVERVGELD